jgi:hypothetical protein
VAGTVLEAPFPAVLREHLETRSRQRIVHSEVDVKRWSVSPPSCAGARPAHCPSCAAASREPGRALRIVGHGLRKRFVEGPVAPGEPATVTTIVTRRYRCRACSAVIVVAPRGVARAFRYAVTAIAWALALWAYERMPAASVRIRTSTAKWVGAADATRWISLPRWTQCADRLFGLEPLDAGMVRQRAARVATFVAAHATVQTGLVSHDAFFGAAFCRPP